MAGMADEGLLDYLRIFHARIAVTYGSPLGPVGFAARVLLVALWEVGRWSVGGTELVILKRLGRIA